MTIAFDAIWIPIVITGAWLVWATILLRDTAGVTLDPVFAWSFAVAWPALVVLASWLVWALLT